jgi:D-glycero-alpha-D-manno-heptose 1-phosphate guanylyltransferase
MEVREAIVLAGGLGTRLKSVTGEIPKVMALVGGRPFLEYVFDYLAGNGISRVIVASGFGSGMVRDHFGTGYSGLELVWSEEREPLGTGGAILQAMNITLTDPVFVLNGDTLFNVPLQTMAVAAGSDFQSVCLALKPMNDFDRYGAVEISRGIVRKFTEKRWVANGLINGGVYLLSKRWLESRVPQGVFSFERNVLEKYVGEGEMSAFISDTYFIDIGIPSDYARAQTEVPEIFGADS